MAYLFQSTLPARGATTRGLFSTVTDADFNPRSPHGERRGVSLEKLQHLKISIHAPRTGSDATHGRNGGVSLEFQSTLPARGATSLSLRRACLRENFNPRSPHGERRPGRPVGRCGLRNFNPRSPHGERPDGLDRVDNRLDISIHAPRTGSDRPMAVQSESGYRFQSTLPARGATMILYLPAVGRTISIHAPRTGSDFSICHITRE